MPVDAKGMWLLKRLSKTVQASMIRSAKKITKKDPAPVLERGVYDLVAEAKSEYFTLGFSKTDIMPDDILKKKYYVAGYNAYNPAKSVLDPMSVSAVWLDDNSGHGGLVMVSVDSVGLTDYDTNLIRQRLEDFSKETGCRSINVLSTHNHAGIDTIGMWGPIPFKRRDEKYLNLVHESIIKVVKEAYANRREGSLFYGKKETPEIQRDTRLPHVFCKDLFRLRFVPNDGSAETWILNYASHTESMLGRPIVSADFAHYMREEIKEEAGVNSIYFIGAIGGLIRLKELDKDPVESTKLGGKALAQTALSIEDERKLKPRISLIRQEYYSTADNYALALLCVLGFVKKDRYSLGEGRIGLSVKTEMTLIKIDDLKMLLLPSEIFPELCYGGYLEADQTAEGKSPDINPKPLLEIADDENMIIFGLANDFTGYVVPPNDFFLHPEVPYVSTTKDRLGRSHYEETNSLGPHTAQIIADTFESMMETVRASENKLKV
ncbi:MAG TPA: hypothetical protein PKW24_06945 [Clostridiales bacterium]|nr:hypothetical protein [Clostridiales bacterium]